MITGVVLVLVVTSAGSVAAANTTTAPEIVAIVPDPVAPDDRGERLVVEFPGPTDLEGWTVTDDDAVARLENRTVDGQVVVTEHPEAVKNRTDLPVVGLRDRLGLANSGETVRLRHAGRLVDAVSYGRSREGYAYVATADGWVWRPIGASSRPAVDFGPAPATAFVLPDAPDVPIATLESANDRLYLGGYTLTDARVTNTLCAARARGVRVRALVEGDPVGGLSDRSAAAFDRLVGCGVDLRVVGGPHARYAFHHAKYAVVDHRAVVMTENWKPAGTGGRSSRGWGVEVRDAAVAGTLAETFEADADWRDAIPWRRYRADASVASAEPPASGVFPRQFEPTGIDTTGVTVLLAPDNAEAGVIALLDGADRSIDVLQVSIGGLDHPFVGALVRAADRGVRVRILLSGAWYVRSDNYAFAAALNDRARRDGLPIEVRVDFPRGRYEKIHAKGAIVDGESVLVGSLNWNNHSVRRNREVALVLHGEEPAAYYGAVFDADWRGGAWRLPVGFGAAVVAVGLGSAVVLGRSVRFDPTPPPDGNRGPGPHPGEVPSDR